MSEIYIPEELKEGLYYDATLDHIMVPKRYSDAVVGHVISNYLSDNHYFSPPLYLAIKGEPGEGKTLQAIASCNQRGIMVKYLSSSKLSGEMESESMQVIERIYNQSLQLQKMGFYVCILLDDFHLGNASIKNSTTRTVNAELLVGYMMNLAESTNYNRIPILLTGNDFSGTYDALLRDGRADIFTWEPTVDEKCSVVESILAPIVQETDIGKLSSFLKRHSDCNIAFFAQLRNDIRKEIVTRALETVNNVDVNAIRCIENRINSEFSKVRVSDFERLADNRIKNRKNGGLK